MLVPVQKAATVVVVVVAASLCGHKSVRRQGHIIENFCLPKRGGTHAVIKALMSLSSTWAEGERAGVSPLMSDQKVHRTFLFGLAGGLLR